MPNKAFDLLVEIAEKSQSNSKGLPRQEVPTNYWLGITFMIADQRFAVPLADVMEVVACPRVTEIPSAAKWIIGFANLQGLLLPIVDLQQLLLNVSLAKQKKTKIIVVGDQKCCVGFMVENIMGLRKFLEDNKIKPENPMYAPYITEAFKLNEGVFNIFNFKSVMCSKKFNQMLAIED